jgi:thymidylate synthase
MNKSYLAFRRIYNDLWDMKHNEVSPRGQKIIEIENYSYTLPPYARFVNFKQRKLSVNYIKREFLWYLNGDRFDTSITKHAKLWKQMMDPDGSINSNYGQYIFGDANNAQFRNAANTLLSDEDSRRASITILNSTHLGAATNDVPCTYALNFRIRKNKLNMSVHMRSQDAIYGMGNDAPAFSLIHEMMHVYLRDIKYEQLEMGLYHHCVDSFHVYEKHYKMCVALAYSNPADYTEVECPRISSINEVEFLLMKDVFLHQPEDEYKFTKWLTTID